MKWRALVSAFAPPKPLKLCKCEEMFLGKLSWLIIPIASTFLNYLLPRGWESLENRGKKSGESRPDSPIWAGIGHKIKRV